MIVFKPNHGVVGDFLSLENDFLSQVNVVLEILMVLEFILKVVAVEEVVKIGNVGLVGDQG
jgi:hypothetical protein